MIGHIILVTFFKSPTPRVSNQLTWRNYFHFLPSTQGGWGLQVAIFVFGVSLGLFVALNHASFAQTAVARVA